LQAKHPRLIVCDISGYGDDGPYRDKKAYDLLIQSEAGFLSVTGTPDDPCKSGNSIADIAAGMYAYTGILAALLQRGKTRQGLAHRRVDARVAGRVDGLPDVLRLRGRHAAAAQRRLARHHLPLRPVPRGRRRHGDAGPAERARVEVFCDKVLLQPQLASDPRFDANTKRSENRGELKRIILEAFGR
jgi:itaconate CoA-transferase